MGIRNWLKKLRAQEDAEAIARVERERQAKEGERWLASEEPIERLHDGASGRGELPPNLYRP
jgi:hypothetical protein